MRKIIFIIFQIILFSYLIYESFLAIKTSKELKKGPNMEILNVDDEEMFKIFSESFGEDFFLFNITNENIQNEEKSSFTHEAKKCNNFNIFMIHNKFNDIADINELKSLCTNFPKTTNRFCSKDFCIYLATQSFVLNKFLSHNDEGEILLTSKAFRKTFYKNLKKCQKLSNKGKKTFEKVSVYEMLPFEETIYFKERKKDFVIGDIVFKNFNGKRKPLQNILEMIDFFHLQAHHYSEDIFDLTINNFPRLLYIREIFLKNLLRWELGITKYDQIPYSKKALLLARNAQNFTIQFFELIFMNRINEFEFILNRMDETVKENYKPILENTKVSLDFFFEDYKNKKMFALIIEPNIPGYNFFDMFYSKKMGNKIKNMFKVCIV